MEMLEEKINHMSRDEAVSFFVKAGVPVAPVYSEPEVMSDPHLDKRGMWINLTHPLAGEIRVPNFPVKLSETPGEVTSPSPVIGEHNYEVLNGLLGFTRERITILEESGVIYTGKPEKNL